MVTTRRAKEESSTQAEERQATPLRCSPRLQQNRKRSASHDSPLSSSLPTTTTTTTTNNTTTNTSSSRQGRNRSKSVASYFESNQQQTNSESPKSEPKKKRTVKKETKQNEKDTALTKEKETNLETAAELEKETASATKEDPDQNLVGSSTRKSSLRSRSRSRSDVSVEVSTSTTTKQTGKQDETKQDLTQAMTRESTESTEVATEVATKQTGKQDETKQDLTHAMTRESTESTEVATEVATEELVKKISAEGNDDTNEETKVEGKLRRGRSRSKSDASTVEKGVEENDKGQVDTTQTSTTKSLNNSNDMAEKDTKKVAPMEDEPETNLSKGSKSDASQSSKQSPEKKDSTVGENGVKEATSESKVASVIPPASQATSVIPPTSQATSVIPPTSQATSVIPPTSRATSVIPPTSQATSVIPPTSQATNNKPKKQKNKKTGPKNELTSFIPGYTAPLRLDSSSLSNQRPGLEALRKRALATDKTTSKFVKGTLANQQETKGVLASKSSAIVASSFKKGIKREAPTHAGDKWFGMIPTPLTDDVKRDLNVIRSRNYLDPKRFYKSSDKPSQYVQVGTVVEGTGEFYAARLTKKQRKSNLTEELMADPTAADYTRRKFYSLQQEKAAKSQKQKQWKHKKGGKRQHI